MLTIAVLVGFAVFGPPVQIASTCSAIQQANGTCSVQNTGTSVEIGGTRPGGSGGNSGGGGGRFNQSEDTTPGRAPCDRVVDPLCRNDINYTVELILRPTLADVASFAPTPVPLVDEPDGVGVVGMPMNFVVDAAVHEQTGELFDLPVTVRFTPASIVILHGDGTSRETATGGRTWAQLRQAQFSATATSHAYGARGTYPAGGIVRYSAAVDFGNGWVAVPGLLEIPTPSTSVQILEVRTALVDRTCAEDPTGPGC